MSIIGQAQRNAAAHQPHRIDYQRMNRTMPKHKSALTRATKTGDPEKVARACQLAIAEWRAIGAWPDNWSLWQCALDDVLPWHQQIDLRDLPTIQEPTP